MDGTQAVTAIIGLIGGIGGLAALVGHIFQRRKIRAEAADVLTDTALTLVEPLQKRVRELEGDAEGTRQKLRTAGEEARALRDELSDVLAIVRRWKAAILNQSLTREDLERMVKAEYPRIGDGGKDLSA